jgi:hypothetical protein
MRYELNWARLSSAVGGFVGCIEMGHDEELVRTHRAAGSSHNGMFECPTQIKGAVLFGCFIGVRS